MGDKSDKDEGGLRRLGEMLGVLQTLEGGPDAVRRPGGAWHHMADGVRICYISTDAERQTIPVV